MTMRKHLIPLLAIALLTIAAYSNSFTVPFHFDDVRDIVENPNIRDFSNILDPTQAKPLHGMTHAGGTDYFKLFFTRIVGFATFAIDYEIYGPDPRGFHVTNLAIHLLAALFVYLVALELVRRAGGQSEERVIPSCTALLFAAHPVLTHAVTYIDQRFASLASCLYFATVFLYLRSAGAASMKARIAWYGAACVTALLAMKTKEIAITLPLMLVAVELAFMEARPAAVAIRTAAFFLAAALVPLGHVLYGSDLAQALANAARGAETSRFTYFLTEQVALATYLRLVFVPVELTFDYDVPARTTVLDPVVMASMLLHAALIGFGLFLIRRSRRDGDGLTRIAGFGILWFYIAFLTEATVIPIREFINEYRLYLPMPGILLATVCLSARLAKRACPERPAPVVTAVLVSAGLIFAVAAHERNEVYQSWMSLTQDAVRKSPLKGRPWQGLGDSYRKAEMYEEALAAYTRSLQLDPANPAVYQSMGFIYGRLGDIDQAEFCYLRAKALDPRDPKTDLAIGFLRAVRAAGQAGNILGR